MPILVQPPRPWVTGIASAIGTATFKTDSDILTMRLLLLGLLAITPVLCQQAAWADEALIKSKACIACHSVEKKIVGPAFKDIAKKRRDEPDAVQLLSEHIRKGSRGVYGPVPMPPNTRVNEAEAKQLAEWILTQ